MVGLGRWAPLNMVRRLIKAGHRRTVLTGFLKQSRTRLTKGCHWRAPLRSVDLVKQLEKAACGLAGWFQPRSWTRPLPSLWIILAESGDTLIEWQFHYVDDIRRGGARGEGDSLICRCSKYERRRLGTGATATVR